MLGGGDLGFSGFGKGGGPIDDALSDLIAFLSSPSVLEASDLAKDMGSALGLVLGTCRELREWVGATNFVGIF